MLSAKGIKYLPRGTTAPGYSVHQTKKYGKILIIAKVSVAVLCGYSGGSQLILLRWMIYRIATRY